MVHESVTDDMLAQVHDRLGGLGVDMQTFGDGTVEVRWKRSYDDVLSDERFASARSITGALHAILNHEMDADIEDEREAALAAH